MQKLFLKRHQKSSATTKKFFHYHLICLSFYQLNVWSIKCQKKVKIAYHYIPEPNAHRYQLTFYKSK